MAGIIATDFKNALTELASDRFTMANEKRMPVYGGLQAIMADTTNLITPATIERAKKSDRKTNSIYGFQWVASAGRCTGTLS